MDTGTCAKHPGQRLAEHVGPTVHLPRRFDGCPICGPVGELGVAIVDEDWIRAYEEADSEPIENLEAAERIYAGLF